MPQLQSPDTVPQVAHPLEEPGLLRREVRRALDRSAAAGILSRPLFGKLPLRRIVPQDVHSLLDYKGGAACITAGLLANDDTVRAAGWALGGAVIGVSLFTDYRLSLAKLIPIEAHELADYAFGLSAVLAPFVLGYARRSPVAAAVHVVVGLSTMVASLFTDYRCQTGMHLGGELMTDPEGIGA